MTAVKINGTFYKRIIQGKDVIADVLPPPAYLIETYLTAFQMLEADSAGLPPLEARCARLRAEYLESQAHWQKDLEDGEMKRLLVEESFRPGLRMLQVLAEDFLPALKAGNHERAKTILAKTIQPQYAAHRAAIDKVVELALKRHRQDEASAAMAVQSRTYGQIALGVLLFFTLAVVSAYAVQKAEPAPAGPAVPVQGAPAAKAPVAGAADPAAEARLNSGRGQIRESA